VLFRAVHEVARIMKAAALDRFGPPSVLKLHELPVPEPAPHEVLIALHAAGVGVWDADIRKGWWPRGRPRFPLVPGTDGAGIVTAKGARVRRFEIGERVWAYEFTNPNGGFYAEYVAVNAAHVGHVPRRLDLLQAGAATVTALTALQGTNLLGLRRKQTVLIFGATGAVGTMAVQFAKGRGARVIATATGRKATRLVLSLGAEGAFDSRAAGAVDRLRELAPEGLGAVLAFAGGPTLDRCLDLVKPAGRVAYPNGVEPAPKRRRRRFSVEGYDAEASPRHFARLVRAVDAVRLQVPIAAVYPLAQAARAHARLERGQVLGRIVLRIVQGVSARGARRSRRP
jgi:NADPH:quinone reductase